MASINTLPIELLHKIVDLTVEDAIALRLEVYPSRCNKEQLRRFILIRLALVSKDFTRPAQLALWRYMDLDNVVEVADLIAAGFGKDKVIKELHIHFIVNARDGPTRSNKLIAFLRGVKRVITITKLIIVCSNFPLDEFFEIDSIQALNSMSIYIYPELFQQPLAQARMPSQLRHLSLGGSLEGLGPLISRLIRSSFSTLASIRLLALKPSEELASTLLPILSSLGPRLQKLEVIVCHSSILSSLLPHCTSLKSLNIHLYTSFSAKRLKTLVDTLGTIPKTAILESFSTILLPHSSNLDDFPSFVQILQTSPFSQLKRLDLSYNIVWDWPFQELVEFVRGNDEFMELLRKRGIVLEFEKEQVVRLRSEREKQKLYRERQDKLDLGSKEEEEEAESKE